MGTINYTSGKGNVFKIGFRKKVVLVEDILKHQDKALFDDMCRTGCKNFGKKLSCPPLSPSFENYSRGYKKCIVYLMSIRMSQMNYMPKGANGYFKVKVANGIIKCLMDNLIIKNRKDGQRLISSGSCRMCTKCAGPGESCKKPYRRVFSYEALGINVSELAKATFKYELQWYKNKTVPKYTTILSGILLK